MYFVIVLDFGYPLPNTPGRTSIDDLAECCLRNYRHDRDAVILAQERTFRHLSQTYQTIGNTTTIPVFLPGRLIEITGDDVGQSSTNGTSGGGSYHVLRAARGIIQAKMGKQEHPHNDNVAPRGASQLRGNPVVHVVAHQAHLPRVLKQGKLFGLNLQPAPNLPSQFYPCAAQWWCRSQPLWLLREIIGFIPLKMAGQI